MSQHHQLILASQSPRRRALLSLLNIPFEVMVANADEKSIATVDPARNVLETAVLKASIIAKQTATHPTLILAADTTVVLNNVMLGKPKTQTEAWDMLIALRQQPHNVYTGHILLDTQSGKMLKCASRATVTMRQYSDAEIASYIASGDPFDKAGAYGIQHSTFRPVATLDGCYLGVMGLSICHLIEMLSNWGIGQPADLTAVLAAHNNYPCQQFQHLLVK